MYSVQAKRGPRPATGVKKANTQFHNTFISNNGNNGEKNKKRRKTK